VATRRRRKPENWLAAVDAGGHGIDVEEPLTPRTRATEALLMGLRLAEGVDLARIVRLAGGDAPVDSAAIARLARLGLVTLAGDRLTVTEAGMPVLDAVLRELVREPAEA
jgi:coproporphyrinogen III oxidase-like Fe-S oxidoreductase